MKKYKVVGLSHRMDAEMNCADCEQASDTFEMFLNSEHYYEGCIVNNETGELLCAFKKEQNNCGTTITYWTAK